MLIREVEAEELESEVAAWGGASETRGKEEGLVTCICCRPREEGRRAAGVIWVVFSEGAAILGAHNKGPLLEEQSKRAKGRISSSVPTWP